MGDGSWGRVWLCPPNQVGHAGGGAKSHRAAPILDQCVSTEASKDFAFTSARPHAHLAAWALVPWAACLRLPVGSWDLGFEGLCSPQQAKLPPRPPFGSGAPWCLHFADPEKSDSSMATRKLGPIRCHPLFKRQPGLGLAEECQEHCAHSGGGWVTKAGTRVDYAPGPRLAEVKAQGWG